MARRDECARSGGGLVVGGEAVLGLDPESRPGAHHVHGGQLWKRQDRLFGQDSSDELVGERGIIG